MTELDLTDNFFWSEHIGKEIGRLRKEHGLSQNGLAALVFAHGYRISQSRIHYIERGCNHDGARIRIHADELVAFARVFGKTIEELMVVSKEPA